MPAAALVSLRGCSPPIQRHAQGLVRLRLAPHVDRFVALDNEMILKHGMQKRGGVGNAGNARAYERG
jgi:hypothetical protein